METLSPQDSSHSAKEQQDDACRWGLSLSRDTRPSIAKQKQSGEINEVLHCPLALQE